MKLDTFTEAKIGLLAKSPKFFYETFKKNGITINGRKATRDDVIILSQNISENKDNIKRNLRFLVNGSISIITI